MQSQPTGNIFLSPFSISQGLMMTLNGAGTQTQTDMEKTLGLGASDMDRVNHANGQLLTALTAPDPDTQLSIANALWGDARITFAPDFTARCKQDYNADVMTLNLAAPAAVESINGWASQSTQGKIPNLVTHDDIAGATAVLTNAVYFHGKWQTPFNKAVTKNAPFHQDADHSKDVPLMRQAGNLPYLETPQFQIAALPYGDGHLSLYVLLPQSPATLETLSDSFTAYHWESTVAAMKPTFISLALPRFQAQSHTRLKKPLSDLGMASAFGGGADFAPMGLQGSCISDVIHAAVIGVDEEGSVAAAATGTSMERGISAAPPSMQVDHPFFIAIRDNITGTILFEGIIRDPE
jgi:serine protease inhibitor